MAGWVKADKAVLSMMMGDKDLLSVYMYLLLRTDHDDTVFKGVAVPRGSIIVTLREMASDLGMSISTLRRCLACTNSSTISDTKTTQRFTMITLCSSASCTTSKKGAPHKLSTASDTNSDTRYIYKETKRKETIEKEDFLNENQSPKPPFKRRRSESVYDGIERTRAEVQEMIEAKYGTSK